MAWNLNTHTEGLSSHKYINIKTFHLQKVFVVTAAKEDFKVMIKHNIKKTGNVRIM
jgi:hypothetical protein